MKQYVIMEVEEGTGKSELDRLINLFPVKSFPREYMWLHPSRIISEEELKAQYDTITGFAYSLIFKQYPIPTYKQFLKILLAPNETNEEARDKLELVIDWY